MLRLMGCLCLGLLLAAWPVAFARASARSDWRQVEKTISRYAAEGAKDQPDATALGNQASLLKLQLQAFVAGHPDSEEAWKARILLPETAFNAAQALGLRVNWRDTVAQLAAVCADPKLPEDERAEADYARISFLTSRMGGDDFTNADLQRTAGLMDAFVRAHPKHKLAPRVALSLGRMVMFHDPTRARELFELATHNASLEQTNQAERELAVLPYRAKPLDWKFTAFGGGEVDLAALRGKVVVVDFWATWCKPCMSEVPTLVSLYQQYHDRGVAFIGISFDDSVVALRKGLAAHHITWPQYYDGRGWDNRYSEQFAIKTIPTMWVLDQSGRVVTTEAWPGNLEYYFKRLLTH